MRRQALGLELQRSGEPEIHLLDGKCDGFCIDGRLERALRFSEWAQGDRALPEGLARALDVLVAEDE